MKISFLIIFLFFIFPSISFAEPPYGNTVQITPDLITETDPTTFVDYAYAGIHERTMFDRRVLPTQVTTLNVHIFNATYSDGLSVEFQVNQEFGSAEASSTQAAFFAPKIGQLPFVIRTAVNRVTIHKGDFTFGGGANQILIHTGRFLESYIEDGLVEEVLMHEAAHSLDVQYALSAEWLQARASDDAFISDYALTYPGREDFAESFLAFVALRHKTNRITEMDVQLIEDTIPNRIAFFDSLHLNMEPLAEFDFTINAGLNDAWYNPATDGQGFFITVFPDQKLLSVAWFTYDTELPSPGASAMLGDPGHRWLTALGSYAGDSANLTIYLTEGGVFDKGDPKPDTDQDGYGAMTIEFADCNEGIVSYEIPSIGLSGNVPIERVAGDNIALCEVLATQ